MANDQEDPQAEEVVIEEAPPTSPQQLADGIFTLVMTLLKSYTQDGSMTQQESCETVAQLLDKYAAALRMYASSQQNG